MPDGVYTNAIERAGHAMSNILSGEVGAAGRSVLDPASLSPEERKKLGERMLGEDAGPMGKILDLVTNPLMLAGLVLTARYPVKHASRLLDWENKIGSYARKQGPGMKFLQNFHESFRGTPLPDMFEHVTRVNHTHMHTWTQAMSDAVEEFQKAGGKLTKEVGAKISAKLDGLDKPDHAVWKMLKEKGEFGGAIPTITLTKQEARLAQRIRNDLTSQWNMLNRMVGGKNTHLVEAHLEKMGIARHQLKTLDNYFPHIESMGQQQVKDRYAEWMAHMQSSGKAARAQAANAPGKQVGKQVRLRHNAMIPEEDGLKAAGMWNDDIARAYEKADGETAALLRQHATEGTAPPKDLQLLRRYSLDPLKTYENYTRGMARTKAWSAPPAEGLEPVGMQIMRETRLVEQHNVVKANMLKDTYIPLATGQLSWEQAVPSIRFTQMKAIAAETLQKMPLPKGVKEVLYKPLEKAHNLSWQKLGGLVQGYLYQTTMGFNPLSPAKNLLQSVITTVPLIGPKYTAKGMREVGKRYSKYRQLRASGRNSEQAFSEAFKEFHGTGFDVGKIKPLDINDMTTDLDKYLPKKGLRGAADKLGETSLAMFTASEKFNRLSAFYGGLAKAADELPGTTWRHPLSGRQAVLKKGTMDFEEATTRFADKVAHMTQFGGGPLNAPHGTLGWWAPFRQFTLFPSRVLEFALGPALRDHGILGRMMLGSAIAYEGGKALFDQDISTALAFGALPQLGDESQPFGVVPMVSPFLQIVGTGISAAANQDVEELRKLAPIVTPFGVVGSRLASQFAPEAAKLIGRPYADYESRTPDGKIPLYARKGNLIGYYSDAQLFAKSVGLGDINSQQEQALMGYMLKQRDRIRGYRRKYLDAMAANDSRKAMEIKNEYERAYPNMGGLHLKKSEIVAMQMRREIPRLERLLDTVPPENREALAGVISASLGSAGPDFMGIDPELFATGSARSRMGNRPRRPGVPGLPSPLATGQLGQGGAANAAVQAGEARRDELAATAFTAFEGF